VPVYAAVGRASRDRRPWPAHDCPCGQPCRNQESQRGSPRALDLPPRLLSSIFIMRHLRPMRLVDALACFDLLDAPGCDLAANVCHKPSPVWRAIDRLARLSGASAWHPEAAAPQSAGTGGLWFGRCHLDNVLRARARVLPDREFRNLGVEGFRTFLARIIFRGLDFKTRDSVRAGHIAVGDAMRSAESTAYLCGLRQHQPRRSLE
jgi:hypothetical protein